MKKILTVIFLIAIFLSVNGFMESDVDAPDNVYLNQPRTVSISIENNALEEKELEVQFIGPSDLFFEFSQAPSEISASDSRRIELFLSPSPQMEGTTYNSTLIVKLGETSVFKSVKLHVSKNIPVVPTITPTPNPTITPTPTPTPSGVFPFILLGSIEGIITFILLILVVLLGLVFIAKLWSIKKYQEVELIE